MLPWGVATFVTMLMLVPFDAISLPVHLPMDAKLDRPVLAALAGLWLASLGLLTGRLKPRGGVGRIHAGVAIFFALAVFSVLLNAGVLTNLNEMQMAMKKLVLLSSFMLFFLITASVVRPEEVRAFVKLLLILGSILSIGTIWEYRFETNVFYDWTARILPGLVALPSDLHTIDITGRTTVYGPTGHPLELALVLALIVPFALVRVLDSQERRERLKWIGVTGLLLAGVFSTQRKTGMLGTGAAVMLMIAYRPRAVKQMLGVGVGLMLVLHVLAPGAMGSLKQQFEPNRVTSVHSTTQRAGNYDAVSPDIRRHPALGRGFGSYDGMKYRILDNQYLGLLITVGIGGTAAYLVMFLLPMGAAHGLIRDRRRPESAFMLAASAGLMSFLVGNALFDVLSFSHITYMIFFLMGLIAVSHRGAVRERAART
jgi:hypothetical protein